MRRKEVYSDVLKQKYTQKKKRTTKLGAPASVSLCTACAISSPFFAKGENQHPSRGVNGTSCPFAEARRVKSGRDGVTATPEPFADEALAAELADGQRGSERGGVHPHGRPPPPARSGSWRTDQGLAGEQKIFAAASEQTCRPC
jgi:hypothetical protein